MNFKSILSRLPVFALLALTAAASAQSGGGFNLDWNTLAGAGGLCSGGPFSLHGTVGQPDASTASTGGSFTLTGGFWTGVTEVGPTLVIARSGPNVLVSWPASATGFYLQHCTDLSQKNWVSNGSPVYSLNVDNVVIEPADTRRFYRLIKP